MLNPPKSLILGLFLLFCCTFSGGDFLLEIEIMEHHFGFLKVGIEILIGEKELFGIAGSNQGQGQVDDNFRTLIKVER